MHGQHIRRSFRHRDNIGGNGAIWGFGNDPTGVEHFTGVVARFPVTRQERTLGIQFADQESLFIRFRPVFVVANAQITGQFAQGFSMTGAFLTNINTHQRYTETLHAPKGVEQFAIGDNAHATGLQRLIARIKRVPELFVLGEKSRRFR